MVVAHFDLPLQHELHHEIGDAVMNWVNVFLAVLLSFLISFARMKFAHVYILLEFLKLKNP